MTKSRSLDSLDMGDRRPVVKARPWGVVMTLVLLAAACGGGEDASNDPSVTQATVPSGDGQMTEPTDTLVSETTEPPTTAAPEEPVGDGVGRATLTIGEESWSFDQVNLCTTTPQQDETVSFVMVIQQGDLQLTARIIDPSGAHRLQGEDVWDRVEFTNVADPTQGAWLAADEAAGEQFLVIDGLSVTAATGFDDLRTTEVEETPGTLDATCP